VRVNVGVNVIVGGCGVGLKAGVQTEPKQGSEHAGVVTDSRKLSKYKGVDTSTA
jgi:hypothetical protein